MRPGVLIAIALACLCSPAIAVVPKQQIAVHVGDGTLNGAFLKPYNNAWFYTVKLSDGREIPQGIWSDHMQWTTVNGRQALLRVQGVSFIGGKSNVTINVFDPKSLAPISSEAHNIDGTIFRRTFDGAHVTSVTLASDTDSKVPKASDLPQAVYDFNGGMYGILLASLPLRPGLRGSLPAIADRDDTLTSEPFEVLRRERIAAGAHGTMSAWVVDSARPGNYTMRFWLTKTPPYIVKLVMTDQAHGRVLSWDMI